MPQFHDNQIGTNWKGEKLKVLNFALALTGSHIFLILEEFSIGVMLSNTAAFERATLGDLWLVIHV